MDEEWALPIVIRMFNFPAAGEARTNVGVFFFGRRVAIAESIRRPFGRMFAVNDAIFAKALATTGAR